MKAWSSLMGWIGAVAILFALLSLLIQLVSGLPLMTSELAWSLGNLIVGGVLLGAALVSNIDTLRERMSSGEARRASQYGTSAILTTLLSIALLALLAFLSTRYHTRWDWTEAGSHSLSSQTLNLLENLERDVEVTALYPAIGSMAARELLDRYTFVSDRFEVEFVDPQAQPGRLRELGVEPDRLEGGLIHVKIGDESVEVKELNEDKLTNALVSLTRRDQKRVYFLIGHNERPIEGEGSADVGGFSFAAEALRNENYQVDPLLLAAQGAVPDDADVVVVAGPTRPLHELEHEALRRYLEGGGSVLALLDPRAKTDFGDSLSNWGVEVGDDVIVDRVQGLFGRPTTPFAAEYGDHPITGELRDSTLFHTARSVQPVEGSGLDVIIRTSEDSFAERNMDHLLATGQAEFGEGDVAGPVPVALAGTPALDGAEAETDDVSAGADEEASSGSAGEARLVVIGDSDFAANQLIGEFRNRDLFVNAVNWLLGDVDAISIRPVAARASRLQLTTQQYMQIRYLALLVAPEVIAMLGIYAWWSRRRAPGR